MLYTCLFSGLMMSPGCGLVLGVALTLVTMGQGVSSVPGHQCSLYGHQGYYGQCPDNPG